MDVKEFASSLLEESGYQLHACLKDVSEESFDKKVLENTMSFRQTLEHLLEVFEAIEKTAKGEKHEWGNFTPPQLPLVELLAKFSSDREKAVETALANFEGMPFLAKDFLVAHEFYHVGQLVTIRLALEPDWNSYSIYRH